jgi:hypothetical protein
MTPAALAEAIARLLEDSDRARRLGAEARARFERTVAWRSVGAPRLVDAYGRVFGPPRGDSAVDHGPTRAPASPHASNR